MHRALYPHLNSREIPDAAVLLKRVEVVSTENWANSFGIPEVVMMRDLAERGESRLMPHLTSALCLQCLWHGASIPVSLT